MFLTIKLCTHVNWIVWNRTDYLYKSKFGIELPLKVDIPSNNQPTNQQIKSRWTVGGMKQVVPQLQQSSPNDLYFQQDRGPWILFMSNPRIPWWNISREIDWPKRSRSLASTFSRLNHNGVFFSFGENSRPKFIFENKELLVIWKITFLKYFMK